MNAMNTNKPTVTDADRKCWRDCYSAMCAHTDAAAVIAQHREQAVAEKHNKLILTIEKLTDERDAAVARAERWKRVADDLSHSFRHASSVYEALTKYDALAASEQAATKEEKQ